MRDLGILLLVGTALFASTWTDAIQAVDGGALVSSACSLHPPDTRFSPLHTLVGHLACAVPWGTSAGRVGLVSTMAGLWTLAVLYLLVVRLTKDRRAALVAALLLASGSIFWHHASRLGPETLAVALALTALYLIPWRGIQQQGWRHLAAGICTGLALCSDLTATLVLPVILVNAVSVPGSVRTRAVTLGLLLGGLSLGLAPALALVAPDPLFPRLVGDGALCITLLGRMLRQAPSQTGWLLWPLGLVGVTSLVRRWRVTQEPLHGPTGFSLGLILVGVPIYLVLVGLLVDARSDAALDRFLVLPYALFAVAVGVGLAVADDRWLGNAARRTYWHWAAWTVVGLSVVLNHPRADLRQRFAVEDHGINCLGVAASGAVVLGEGVLLRSTLEHARDVLGRRRDLRLIDLGLLHQPWYVARLPWYLRQHAADPLRLIQAEMRHGGTVYQARPLREQTARGAREPVWSGEWSTPVGARWSRVFAAYPVGPLMRLLPPGELPPAASEVARINERVFRGLLHRGGELDPGIDPDGARLRETYAQAWRWIAVRLLRTGDRKGAMRALLRGQRWVPWLEVPSWLQQRAMGGQVR